MQALLAPVLKSIVLGGIGIGVALGFGHHSDHRDAHRLRLHAIAKPDSIYVSAFMDDDQRVKDIVVRYDASAERPLHWTMHATALGCHWLGIETLVPIDAHTFGYLYSEEVLGCEPGVEPTAKTPRTGTVTVDD